MHFPANIPRVNSQETLFDQGFMTFAATSHKALPGKLSWEPYIFFANVTWEREMYNMAQSLCETLYFLSIIESVYNAGHFSDIFMPASTDPPHREL